MKMYLKTQKYFCLFSELTGILKKIIYYYPNLLENITKEYISYIGSCSLEHIPDPNLLYIMLLSFLPSEKIDLNPEAHQLLLENFKDMTDFLESFIKILVFEAQKFNPASIFSYLSACCSHIYGQLQIGDPSPIIISKYVIKISLALLEDHNISITLKTHVIDMLAKITASFFNFYTSYLKCDHNHASPNWTYLSHLELFDPANIVLLYIIYIIDQHGFSLSSKHNNISVECPKMISCDIPDLMYSFVWASIHPFIQNIGFKFFQLSSDPSIVIRSKSIRHLFDLFQISPLLLPSFSAFEKMFKMRYQDESIIVKELIIDFILEFVKYDLSTSSSFLHMLSSLLHVLVNFLCLGQAY